MTFLVNPFFYPPNTPVVIGAAMSAQAQGEMTLTPNPIVSAALVSDAASTLVMVTASNAAAAFDMDAAAILTLVAQDAPKTLIVDSRSTMTMAGAAIARAAMDADAGGLAAFAGAAIAASAIDMDAAAALTGVGTTTVQTLSLNHFNGSGSTYSDAVGGITWSEPSNTSPSQVASPVQFGAGSLQLPGQALGETQIVRGSGWASPNAGNWSAEFWFVAQFGNDIAIFLTDASGNIAVQITFTGDFDGANAVTVNYFDSGGSNFLTQSAAWTGTLAFRHFAIQRDDGSGNYALFRNGSRIDLDTSATDVRSFTRVDFQISGDSSTNTLLRVDEWRLTDGVQYSGATYTVPASEFTP